MYLRVVHDHVDVKVAEEGAREGDEGGLLVLEAGDDRAELNVEERREGDLRREVRAERVR